MARSIGKPTDLVILTIMHFANTYHHYTTQFNSKYNFRFREIFREFIGSVNYWLILDRLFRKYHSVYWSSEKSHQVFPFHPDQKFALFCKSFSKRKKSYILKANLDKIAVCQDIFYLRVFQKGYFSNHFYTPSQWFSCTSCASRYVPTFSNSKRVNRNSFLPHRNSHLVRGWQWFYHH